MALGDEASWKRVLNHGDAHSVHLGLHLVDRLDLVTEGKEVSTQRQAESMIALAFSSIAEDVEGHHLHSCFGVDLLHEGLHRLHGRHNLVACDDEEKVGTLCETVVICIIITFAFPIHLWRQRSGQRRHECRGSGPMKLRSRLYTHIGSQLWSTTNEAFKIVAISQS